MWWFCSNFGRCCLGIDQEASGKASAAAKPKVMVGGSDKDDEENNYDVQEVEDTDEEMYEPP